MPSPGPIIENSHRGMTVRLGEERFERAECGAHGHGPRFTELRSVLRPCAQPRVHTRPDVGESEQTVTATVNFTAFNNYQWPVARHQCHQAGSVPGSRIQVTAGVMCDAVRGGRGAGCLQWGVYCCFVANILQSEGLVRLWPMRDPIEAGGACITQKSTILRLHRSKGPLVLPRLFQMDSTPSLFWS